MQLLYNKDVKTRFIVQNYPKEGSRKTVNSTFSGFFNTEEQLKKDIFDFTQAEIKTYLYNSNMALNTQKTTINRLKKYIDWAINEGYTSKKSNPLAELPEDFYEELTEAQFLLSNIEILEIIRSQANIEDKALIAALFEGIYGRGCSEIINLTINDIDNENGVFLDDNGVKRYLILSEWTKRLLKQTYENKMSKSKGVKLNNIFNLGNNINKKINETAIFNKLKLIEKKMSLPKFNPNYINKSGQLFTYKRLLEVTDYQKMSTREKNKILSETLGKRYNWNNYLTKAKYKQNNIYIKTNNYLNEKVVNKLYENSVIAESNSAFNFPISFSNQIEMKKVTQDLNKLEEVLRNQNFTETEISQIIKSRIGQSYFREMLYQKQSNCWICGIRGKSLLRASHVKPWKDSTNNERIDVNNGLLLCPNHDVLFDKGFITFKSDGNILVSTKLNSNDREKMLKNITQIKFNEKQKKYIEWHEKNVFLV